MAKAIKASSPKRGSGPRELITPKKGGPSRYQRRNKVGTFGPGDDVGKSQKADRRVKAKKKVKPGYGDLGDQKKRK
jgi:hypothetical protein